MDIFFSFVSEKLSSDGIYLWSTFLLYMQQFYIDHDNLVKMEPQNKLIVRSYLFRGFFKIWASTSLRYLFCIFSRAEPNEPSHVLDTIKLDMPHYWAFWNGQVKCSQCSQFKLQTWANCCQSMWKLNFQKIGRNKYDPGNSKNSAVEVLKAFTQYYCNCFNH